MAVFLDTLRLFQTLKSRPWLGAGRPAWNYCRNVDCEKSCIFPTNLHSFVSFGKTHKLHNAIDHWLARVTGWAHVALDAVTKEERAVYTDRCGDRGEEAAQGGERWRKDNGRVLGHLGKTGTEMGESWPEDGLRVTVDGATEGGLLCTEWEEEWGNIGVLMRGWSSRSIKFTDLVNKLLSEPKNLWRQIWLVGLHLSGKSQRSATTCQNVMAICFHVFHFLGFDLSA